MELHGARQSNGYAALPISFAELHAWATLTAKALTPTEVELVRALDRAFLDHEQRKADERDRAERAKRASAESGTGIPIVVPSDADDDADDGDDDELDTLYDETDDGSPA